MAKNGKQNIAKNVIKAKSTVFSPDRYHYSENLFINGPYLHSSAATFGSAAQSLWAGRNYGNLRIRGNNPYLAAIEKQKEREAAVYAQFKGGKKEFLGLLNSGSDHFDTNAVLDKVYGTALDIIGKNANLILQEATAHINAKGDAALEKPSIISYDLAEWAANVLATDPDTHEKIKALLRYSPKDKKKEYFMLQVLGEYVRNPSKLDASMMKKILSDKNFTSQMKSWQGKVNNLIGQYGEEVAIETLEKNIKATGKRKISVENVGGGYTEGVRNVADIILHFDYANFKQDYSISVKTNPDFRRDDMLMSEFKFKDTTIDQLLNSYEQSELKSFLTYLITNITYLKGGESRPIFAGSSGHVGKSGLKVVENIVNDILSTTLPTIMLSETPKLTTDFIYNARTNEVTPASELLTRLYNATVDYKGEGYRTARALASIPSASAVDALEMSRMKRRALKHNHDDKIFAYPDNLLSRGRAYGKQQLGGIGGKPLSIKISVIKKILAEAIL